LTTSNDQNAEDRYAIEDVLRRYCRGVDRGDAPLIASAYHEDAYDDHGGFKGSGRAFAERLVESTRDRWIASQHQLHQTNIDFDDNLAWVETYFTAYHRVVDEAGDNVLETFAGRYVDRFEKRASVWGIAKRTVVYDWSQIQKVDKEYPSEVFQQGKRSKEDPSYQR